MYLNINWTIWRCRSSHVSNTKNKDKIWVSIKNDGLSVKNMSDLLLKEIYGKYGTKSPTNEQIRRYKMNEREISEKYDNLIENELNEKSNERVYVKNDVITFVTKHSKGWKKSVKEA